MGPSGSGFGFGRDSKLGRIAGAGLFSFSFLFAVEMDEEAEQVISTMGLTASTIC